MSLWVWAKSSLSPGLGIGVQTATPHSPLVPFALLLGNGLWVARNPKPTLIQSFRGCWGNAAWSLPATPISLRLTAPNLNHLLFGQVVDNMQAVQKLAVDTTIFHAQAREMKVLPEYGLPAWMEACVEDGPGDAKHYHPPSLALMWNST